MGLDARGLALALACFSVAAQGVPQGLDWKEASAPPPPPLQVDRLIPVEIPRTTLRYGIDPASVSLGTDGVVRYVVVARGESGAVNAMYEGIRCDTAEMRLYARHDPSAGWRSVEGARWQPLRGSANRHSLVIARTGACVGNGPNYTAAQIVRDLRAPVDTRFNTN